jgi:multisubunit Na+/H+ antiporter MnhB subunit
MSTCFIIREREQKGSEIDADQGVAEATRIGDMGEVWEVVKEIKEPLVVIGVLLVALLGLLYFMGGVGAAGGALAGGLLVAVPATGIRAWLMSRQA